MCGNNNKVTFITTLQELGRGSGRKQEDEGLSARERLADGFDGDKEETSKMDLMISRDGTIGVFGVIVVQFAC